ncbi:MAG: DNA polymerase/3'-5' exonuclease PolX [Microgenomates group bacterium]
MNNQEIAKLLRSVAAAYEVKGGNKFKVMAYDRAATAVEHATSELKDLWDDGKLDEVPGIGKSIASHLDELFRTGRVKHFENLMKNLPPAMFELLELPGLGAKRAYKLCQELGIWEAKGAIDKLEKAGKEGKIALIETFGETSQKNILEAIAAFKKGEIKENRMNLPYAWEMTKEILSYLEKNSAVLRADPLGSLRRKTATVGDIDIAVATNQPEKVISYFLKFPKIRKIIEKGPSGTSVVLTNGRQVDLRVQRPTAYGAMLQYFTGSKQHNIHLRELALKMGLSLSEYGIKVVKKLAGQKLKMKNYNSKMKIYEFANEEEFYQALGLPWIPPELREDTGEIEAAQKGKLPNLVTLKDIKGDLHTHSNFPIEESHDPGQDTIEKMIVSAENLGYEYLGFAEHNPSQSQHTEKQIIELIKRKKDYIDKINYSRVNKLLKKVFNGLEIDIKPNGELALPDKAFSYLDYAIASVHSNFRMPRKKMTKRILRALAHPKVKILGHPTGRKIGKREGYELDWEKIFAFCLKYDKWLEINAWPDRLDLPDSLVREAVKNGVKMIINTDSHAFDHLYLMEYGVAVARRGWAEKKDIVNTLDCDTIIKKLKLKN